MAKLTDERLQVEVKSGMPMPRPRGGKTSSLAEKVRAMKVGETMIFTYPLPSARSSLQSRFLVIGATMGAKFMFRNFDDGGEKKLGCWRVS